MDELALVERLRAEVPEPTTADLTAAETRFLAAITDPEAATTGPPAAVAGAAGGMEGKAGGRRPDQAASRLGRWSAAPRRLRLGVLAAGVAGAVAAATIVVDHIGGDAPPSPLLVGFMEKAAAAALNEKDLAPRPDQYIYQETWQLARTSVSDGDNKGRPPMWLERSRHQWWRSADGSRPNLIRQSGQQRLPYPGRSLPPEAGEVPSSDGDSVTAPCGTRPPLERPYLSGLPTDPDKLLEQIDSGEGERGDRLWESVSDLVNTTTASPRVRATLLRAIARIPGVRLAGDATDAAGRHGMAATRVQGGIREELIFDRTTYRFLGERSVAVKAGAYGPAGSVVGSTAVLRTAVVDNMPKPAANADYGDC